MKTLTNDALPLALQLGCVVSLCSPLHGEEMSRGRACSTPDDKLPDLALTPEGSDKVRYVALSPDGEAFLQLV